MNGFDKRTKSKVSCNVLPILTFQNNLGWEKSQAFINANLKTQVAQFVRNVQASLKNVAVMFA